MTTPEKRFVFHVGAHATGGWLIQRYLANHAAALEAQGVAVAPRPQAALAGRGKLLDDAGRFARVVRTALANPDAGVFLGTYEHVIGDAFGSGQQGQTGSGLYPNARPALDVLAKIVRAYRATIILTVCPQPDFLESFYVRAVNAGGVESFDTWLAGRDLDDLSWLPLHESLVAAFGPDAVQVLDCRHPGPVEAVDLAAFFRAAGLAAPTRVDSPMLGHGMSDRALRLALAANPHLSEAQERTGLRSFLQKNFPEGRFAPPKLFSDEQRAALDGRYAAEYERLVAPVAAADGPTSAETER